MLEKTVETYLVDRVRAAGGDAYKFTSPQRRSVPDRIVAFPPGRLYFVELKRPGNKPTKPQLREHERLRTLGCDVRVIDSREAVDAFVREASAPPAPYLHVYEYPSPFGGTHREFSPTTWNGQQPARTVALYAVPQQPTTENSRADALTGLLPCPFCGGEANHIQGFEPLDDAHFIDCATCGVSSKVFDTKEAAFAAWNLRAASPANQPAAAPIDEPVAAWINYPVKTVDGEFAGYGKPELSFTRPAYGYDITKAEPLYRRVPAPSPSDERAAFEAWVTKEWPGLQIDRAPLMGFYRGDDGSRLEDMWTAWQVRAASASATGALGYAQRLATSLWEKHWRDSAPQWKVLDDTLGVLTQIDNMVCGLSRSPAMAAEAVGWFDKALNQIRWRDGLVNADFRDGQPFYTQPAQADARVGLTAEMRSTLESLARTSTPYEHEVLRSILARGAA